MAKITKIRIVDLKTRATIGINAWERKVKQNIIINIALKYDSSKAVKADSIKYAFDYKKITKTVLIEVSTSRFFLLESLASHILKLITVNKKITSATVRVDKPLALRFAKSVSAEVSFKH